jgi:hypothetical protein
MKVYEIEVGIEVRHGKGARRVLAGLDFCNPKDVRFFSDEFMGKPYARKWKPVRFYIDRPLLPRPDFFIGGSWWICNERAMLLAGEPMEMTGEFLPVEIEGEKGEFQLFHVTNCINVLDPKKSRWEMLGGTWKMLEKPAFKPKRLGEETLFKISEDYGVTTYCLERTGQHEDGEFKALVEHHGLAGIRFDLIWSDEKPR